jgi:hypothetical protein
MNESLKVPKKTKTQIGKYYQPRALNVDSVTKRKIVNSVRGNSYRQKKLQPLLTTKIILPINLFSNWKQFFYVKKIGVSAALMALFLAFGFGAWFALNTTNSKADSDTYLLSETSQVSQQSVPGGSIQLEGVAAPDLGSDAANNSNLFNTPIEYLQSYFSSANKPDAVGQRALEIEQFLKDMYSPLSSASETIARQDHWKLILAIGFAESTLGKNCSDNNCSNIGVGPGHKLWRKYTTYSEWVLDFNRLLERRYKDWTLQEMCGVYVQPCNNNWLLATKQILDELDKRGIE